MFTLSHILLAAAGTTGLGSLAIVATMQECKIARVSLLLLLKVWGMGLLLAIPLGVLSALLIP